MISDIGFEAAFLRAALLVGLVDEREVPAWAFELITKSPEVASQLADVLLAPSELSAMREALRPIGEGIEGHRVAEALLIAVAAEHATTRRAVTDRLRILGHIRREFPLPSEVSARIKEFEDGAMLAAAGVAGAREPGAEELTAWLDVVREDGYFQFSFDTGAEAAAFLAALSRRVVRDRTWGNQLQPLRARAWLIREPTGRACSMVLNERAWLTVVREFSPVPLAARIPRVTVPVDSIEVFDESTAAPLGVDEARARIAGEICG